MQLEISTQLGWTVHLYQNPILKISIATQDSNIGHTVRTPTFPDSLDYLARCSVMIYFSALARIQAGSVAVYKNSHHWIIRHRSECSSRIVR